MRDVVDCHMVISPVGPHGAAVRWVTWDELMRLATRANARSAGSMATTTVPVPRWSGVKFYDYDTALQQ